MKKKTGVNCPICKSNDTQEFEVNKDYQLDKCDRCQMVWDSHPPSNPLLQYNSHYFKNDNPKGGYSNYFRGMKVNRKTFADRLNKLEKLMGKKGKLLDVGCALGECLMVAKDLGWKDVAGIEVSDYAYHFAKKRNLDIRKGTLLSTNFKKNTFDVVLYQDVIEHLTNPTKELKKVISVLKPGGIVFIVTPDIRGWWSRLLGSSWYHYKPKEHLMYFSQTSIRRAFELAGFERIKTNKTYHILSLEYILDRLQFYSPAIFGMLLKIFQKTPFKNAAFRSYTGELEAWGIKPGK